MPSYFCIFLLFYTHLASASQVKSCANRPFQCLNSSEAQSCDLRKPAVTYQVKNARMLVVSQKSWADYLTSTDEVKWESPRSQGSQGSRSGSLSLCASMDIPHHPTTLSLMSQRLAISAGVGYPPWRASWSPWPVECRSVVLKTATRHLEDLRQPWATYVGI